MNLQICWSNSNLLLYIDRKIYILNHILMHTANFIYSHRNMSRFSEKEGSMNLISRKRSNPSFLLGWLSCLSIVLSARFISVGFIADRIPTGFMTDPEIIRQRDRICRSWEIYGAITSALELECLHHTGKLFLWFAALDSRNTMGLLSVTCVFFLEI